MFIPAAASANEDETSGFPNPFVSHYEAGPGPIGVGVHIGSFLRDGVGPRLTFVPWQHLELTAAYGYNTQHAFAGLVAVNVLPRALLQPYLPVGYSVSIADLPRGISLTTHYMVAGIGLRARVLSRYFVGAEVIGNGAITQILRERRDRHELAPSQRFVAKSGIHLGVQFF